jgi:2-iminobutanoate/2-iminopropanoate deaminase
MSAGRESAGRQSVSAAGAPPALGPYSHGVVADLRSAGKLLFCSGQIPLEPDTGELLKGTVGEQARRCLENLQAVCNAAGTSLDQAVRLTVYMTDLHDFATVNEVYGSFFASDPPARVAVEVAALPMGAEVEIDAIVLVAAAEADR